MKTNFPLDLHFEHHNNNMVWSNVDVIS